MHLPDDKYGVLLSLNYTEETAKANGLSFYAAAVVNPGESFLYKKGKWYDWVLSLDYVRTYGVRHSASPEYRTELVLR